jgi:hypothetical protein
VPNILGLHLIIYLRDERRDELRSDFFIAHMFHFKPPQLIA